MKINGDFSRTITVDTDSMDWVPSPMAGVDRRMLDRIGDEVARATSIVRYAPESYFSSHTHDGGEEFLVLDGTFVDEHGDYPTGMYVRNPVGSSHTPSSPEGCTIFVKLWQMEPEDQTFVRTRLEDATWRNENGVETAPLYTYGDEVVDLIRLSDASATLQFEAEKGAELLVLQGAVTANGENLACHGWARYPLGATVNLRADEPAMVWRKRGHLTSVKAPAHG